jgi:cell division protein FtsN
VAQDFAKKKNASSRKGGSGSGIPGWVWLLTGAVTGAFIMFLVYLAGLTPQKLLTGKSAQDTKLSAQHNDQSQPAEKPTFEFYDSLKNNEIIPPGDTSKSGSSSKTGTLKTPYMLQVGSFPKAQDADALKAKLILEGLDASIQQFNKNGEIYHRVLVGPFTDQNKMNQAKTTLAQQNITPIVLQKKNN